MYPAALEYNFPKKAVVGTLHDVAEENVIVMNKRQIGDRCILVLNYQILSLSKFSLEGVLKPFESHSKAICGIQILKLKILNLPSDQFRLGKFDYTNTFNVHCFTK